MVQGTFSKVVPKARPLSWRGRALHVDVHASAGTRSRSTGGSRARKTRGRAGRGLTRAAGGPRDARRLSEGPVLTSCEAEELARLVRVALDYLPIRYGNALEVEVHPGSFGARGRDASELSHKAAESLLTRARQAFRDGFGTVIGG